MLFHHFCTYYSIYLSLLQSELYENFVTAKRETNDDRTPLDKKTFGSNENPLLTRISPGEKPKGNTIFVQGIIKKFS